jgi:hypothetical protein
VIIRFTLQLIRQHLLRCFISPMRTSVLGTPKT